MWSFVNKIDKWAKSFWIRQLMISISFHYNDKKKKKKKINIDYLLHTFWQQTMKRALTSKKDFTGSCHFGNIKGKITQSAISNWKTIIINCWVESNFEAFFTYNVMCCFTYHLKCVLKLLTIVNFIFCQHLRQNYFWLYNWLKTTFQIKINVLT